MAKKSENQVEEVTTEEVKETSAENAQTENVENSVVAKNATAEEEKKEFVEPKIEAVEEPKVVEKPVKRFTMEQFYNSKKYSKYKNIIKVVLKKGEKYTYEEAERKIEEFKRKVVG